MNKKIYRPSIIKLLYIGYKAQKHRYERLHDINHDAIVQKNLFTYSQTVYPGKYILTNTKTNKHEIMDLVDVMTSWRVRRYIGSTRASLHKYNKYVNKGQYGLAISYIYKSISVKSKIKNKLVKKVGSLLFQNFHPDVHVSLPPKRLAVGNRRQSR